MLCSVVLNYILVGCPCFIRERVSKHSTAKFKTSQLETLFSVLEVLDQ